MPRRALMLSVLLAACGGSRAVAPVRESLGENTADVRALWVDASAAEGGDGSRARPMRTVAAAVAQARGPTTIHVATGLYEAPKQIGTGVRISGTRAVVLHGPGPGAIIRTREDVMLESVLIQGGDVGIEANGNLRLQNVHFSGQRRAVILQRTGRLTAKGIDLAATVSETTGVEVDPEASARIESSTFRGGFRVAIEAARESRVEVRTTRFEGAATAIRSRGGKLRVESSSTSGGRGPGFVCAQGEAFFGGVTVLRHEYGVLASNGCSLTVRGYTSSGAERAGIGIVGTDAQVSDLVVIDSGGSGGVHAVGGSLRLRDFWIARARSYGIHVHGGTADLADGVVSDVSGTGGDGDGIHVRAAKARVGSVSVRRTAGAGVLAAQGARMVARDLLLEENRSGGIVVDSLARLEAASIFVRRSGASALVVPGEASVKIDLLLSADNAQGAVWAECGSGAQVLLSRVRTESSEPISSACVGEWARPHLFDPFAE